MAEDEASSYLRTAVSRGKAKVCSHKGYALLRRSYTLLRRTLDLFFLGFYSIDLRRSLLAGEKINRSLAEGVAATWRTSYFGGVCQYLGAEYRVSNGSRAYPLFPNSKNFVKRMIRIYTTNYYPSRIEWT